MEDLDWENDKNEVSVMITVVGLTPESARAIAQQFISWLDNQGEQDFWNACDEIGGNTRFKYNLESNNVYTNWVVIEEYAKK